MAIVAPLAGIAPALPAGKTAPSAPSGGGAFTEASAVGPVSPRYDLVLGCESLNSDPYNLRAEEQALRDCTLGVEVRRTWCETEMVRSIDGRHFPGTPDGMFETWDGILTCVQVVRVPLVPRLSPDAMMETLAQTVLTKVVKSQQWLCASHVVPADFVIFCWLPFPIPDAVAAAAEELMLHVRVRDPRFSLRLRVPAEADALFPALFASNHEAHSQKRTRVYSWSDVATAGSDTESDDEDACSWDITWMWDEDWARALEAEEGSGEQDDEGSVCSVDDADHACSYGKPADRQSVQGSDVQMREGESSSGGDSWRETSFVSDDAG